MQDPELFEMLLLIDISSTKAIRSLHGFETIDCGDSIDDSELLDIKK